MTVPDGSMRCSVIRMGFIPSVPSTRWRSKTAASNTSATAIAEAAKAEAAAATAASNTATQAVAGLNQTISGYGDIVSRNAAEFATAA